MAHPVSTVDRLPEAERSKILNAILSGETLSSLATRLGISRQAMSSYKNRVILPATKIANEIADARKRNRPQPDGQGDDQSPIYASPKEQAIAEIAENKVLTREVVRASPLMERHQFLWESTAAGITAAKDAVRVTYDDHGNEVSIAQDLSALAPLLNQGHKSIEILGKLTGELKDDHASTGLTIQIVCPAFAPAEVGRISFDTDDGCIDMSTGLK